MTLKDVLVVMQRTINSVDGRLTNHGEQVAYLCMRMGKAVGFPPDRLLNVSAVAMLHDIGAYKVEERTRLTEFEVEHPHEHSCYGYLFLREFSPFDEIADMVLYHHWKYEDRQKTVLGRPVPPEAFLIHMADRISVLYAQSGNRLMDDLALRIQPLSDIYFNPQDVALIVRLAEATDLIECLISGDYIAEIHSYFDAITLSSKEAVDLLATLMYVIGFRSRQTVVHSASVVSAMDQICRLSGMPEQESTACHYAALLHDIGKITTPLEILSKPGRLTAEEMVIMQEHVVATEEILTGSGLDDISAIASYHHEKLNGNGYPHHSRESDLSLGAKLLAAADILAALVEPRYYKPALAKSEVLSIMVDAVSDHHIDASAYRIIRQHYDLITSAIRAEQMMMLGTYDRLSNEYGVLTEEMHQVLDSQSTVHDTNIQMAA